mgnify:FL=1
MRTELAHVVNDEGAIAGSLASIRLSPGFLLSSEGWKVRIAVMDNAIPVKEVSKSICEQEEERRTTRNVNFLTRE